MIRVYEVRRWEAARMAQLLGCGRHPSGPPACSCRSRRSGASGAMCAGLGGCGHLLIAEREGQPVAFMGVEEVTVNEQDPHAVGFYR